MVKLFFAQHDELTGKMMAWVQAGVNNIVPAEPKAADRRGARVRQGNRVSRRLPD
jgi:hypothetical protein